MKAHMKTHESPTSKLNTDIYSSKIEETNKHEVDENCPELDEEMSVDWKKNTKLDNVSQIHHILRSQPAQMDQYHNTNFVCNIKHDYT